ncbi:MAG: hypothetical protein KBA66_18050 [Leptospiraceae bacterium]|nr:hypothetical protein [Leptospiraceae bacterium]
MNQKNLFSQRKGLVKIDDELQIDSLSNASKNHIWDCLYKTIFVYITDPENSNTYFEGTRTQYIPLNPKYASFLEKIWTHWIGLPLDQIPKEYKIYYQQIKETYSKLQWDDVYNFLEFIFIHSPNNDKSISLLNSVFEEDNIGYRIINNEITDIINPLEIKSVNTALLSPFQNSNTHLSKALHLLYKEPPDYSNSIKESISAVENVVKFVTGDTKGTLAAALLKLDKNNDMHRAFKDALIKLYGYTSDADGIRHALMEETNLSHADAKLFLIQCSAFVNYLTEKYGKGK